VGNVDETAPFGALLASGLWEPFLAWAPGDGVKVRIHGLRFEAGQTIAVRGIAKRRIASGDGYRDGVERVAAIDVHHLAAGPDAVAAVQREPTLGSQNRPCGRRGRSPRTTKDARCRCGCPRGYSSWSAPRPRTSRSMASLRRTGPFDFIRVGPSASGSSGTATHPEVVGREVQHGAAARGARLRGHRRRPELRSDVRAAEPELPSHPLRHEHLLTREILRRAAAFFAKENKWVGDITSIRTWEGWLYLAAIVDLFSRRVVGWAAAEHMRTELVVEALERAVRHRQPAEGLTFHSDRG
jgi:hypothetical protein